MSNNSSKHDELRALMDQALETCVLLQKYTDENFDIYLSDDDAKINDTIDNREKLIQVLISIEYKTDILLDEVDNLPHDVDALRRSVRAVLSDVSLKDMEIMKRISSRMQMYKTQTLKARNQKNLSTYMRTAFSTEPGDGIDFTK